MSSNDDYDSYEIRTIIPQQFHQHATIMTFFQFWSGWLEVPVAPLHCFLGVESQRGRPGVTGLGMRADGHWYMNSSLLDLRKIPCT